MSEGSELGTRRVGNFECTECGLTVRLSMQFPMGSADYECRRCGSETKHVLQGDAVPETEVESYV